MRNLVIILGDQLDAKSAAFDDFDKDQDAVWMAEVAGEATHVWSHKARIAFFLAAMRHFRDDLQSRGLKVCYRQLADADNRGDFAGELAAAVKGQRPQRLVLVEPGEWRVKKDFEEAAAALKVPLDIRSDRHFFASHEDFHQHADGRKRLRLEYFYREMRRKTDVLMQGNGPIGAKWNYDSENRGSFSKDGPVELSKPRRFHPDTATIEVLALIENRFANHPGNLDHFDWPVTAGQAEDALQDFIEYRLPHFGEYQDAMWSDEPFLYHSRLSAAMNVKLLNPRDVVHAAEAAYRSGWAPLNAVEGFIRQVLGWREFVRGVYWRYMPEYLERNELQAELPLPGFYWTGETDMNCLRQAVGQTLEYGYAHHIQRLMVTGLFALLLGVKPQAVHEWFLAVYVDAVEWVELPNSLGMSQFADGGVMASKPYAASGKYIQRMSNYCAGCGFNPAAATGDDACPLTTLYWDFLMRHERKMAANPRMSFHVKNVKRKDAAERRDIRKQAEKIRAACC